MDSDSVNKVNTTTLLALVSRAQWGRWCLDLEMSGALWASLDLAGDVIAVVPYWTDPLPPLPALVRWCKLLPLKHAVEVFRRFRAKRPAANARGCLEWETLAGLDESTPATRG